MGLISNWMLTTTGGWNTSVSHRAARFFSRMVLLLSAATVLP
jgi:hypothetical protein